MPLPLRHHLDEIVNTLLAAERALLCTDFDGTLVPIADDPAHCMLDDRTQRILAALHRPPRLHVAVVSGRGLADLRRRVGVDGLVYAGNHGLEIDGAGLVYQEPAAFALRGALSCLAAELDAAIAAIEGAWLEHKGLSCSIHYRRVRPEAIATLRAAVARTAARPVAAGLVRLHGGKYVVEVRPNVAWDKGRAFAWLGDGLGCAPADRLFVGDDETDEDAFRVAREAITIRVGPPDAGSAARYGATAGDVMALLAALRQALDRRPPRLNPVE